MEDLQFFDRRQSYTVVRRGLPHWSQAGTVCFITWRTADSLPRAAIERLAQRRQEALRAMGIDDMSESSASWPDSSLGERRLQEQAALARLTPREQAKFRWLCYKAWDAELDCCRGACVLSRPELSELVASSLEHFDGTRYVLTDYVVMPNHVHVLAAFADESQLLAQCEGWKRYTSTSINKALGSRGHFWQGDSFDHLARSDRQFDYLRAYIAANPKKAGLRPEMYRHFSKALT
jgi:putative transposase